MLRLEKTKGKSQFRVSIKHKNSFFNPLLNIALLWAVGLHVSGFLLFHIVPFKINYTGTIFPPVSVSSDPGKIAESYIAGIDEELVPIPSYLLLPQHEVFTASEISFIKPQKELSFYCPSDDSSLLFLDQATQWLAHGYLPLSGPEAINAKLHISGPLSEYTVTCLKTPHIKGEQTLVFDILVNGQTGRVIWFCHKDASSIYDQEIENWLTTLHFSTDSMDFIQGRIEAFRSVDG